MLSHALWRNIIILAQILMLATLFTSSSVSLGAENILVGKWQTDSYEITEGNVIKKPIIAGTTLHFFENNVFVLSGTGKNSIGGKYTLQNNSELRFNLPLKVLVSYSFPKRCKVQRLQDPLTLHGELKDGNTILYILEAKYTLIDALGEKATFSAPTLDGFAIQKEWDDSTIDPLWKDTHHVKYANSTGDRIDKLAANQWIIEGGKAHANVPDKDSMVWAWDSNIKRYKAKFW